MKKLVTFFVLVCYTIEDVMTQHVVSMLRYMKDQKDFCEMVGIGYFNEDNYLGTFAANEIKMYFFKGLYMDVSYQGHDKIQL